jgi:hypothetical protein
MALPINPTLTEVVSASSVRGRNTNTGVASGLSQSSAVFKSELDRNISLSAGGPGSGLGPNPGIGDYPGGGAEIQNNNVSALAGVPTNFNSLSPGLNNPGISSTVPGGAAQGETIASGSSSSGSSRSNGLSNILGAVGAAAAIFAAGSRLLSFVTKVKQDQPARLPVEPGDPNDWRVRIDAPWDLFGMNFYFDLLRETGGVVFPYLPNITFSSKANYTPVDVVHSNYPFYAYKNSAVDDINISGDFTAETSKDAEYWIAATTFFRTATKMFFGQGENAGNPPIICKLYGYGASMFEGVPIIIKSFQVDFKDDVNYIKGGLESRPVWVPVLSTIQISVTPVYNREKLRQFNLRDYALNDQYNAKGYL